MPYLGLCDIFQKTDPAAFATESVLELYNMVCHIWLVIHVDKIVVEIEGKLQTVGEFHLDITTVTVDGMDLYSGEVAVDISHDLLGYYARGNYGILAVHLLPLAVLVELDLDGVGEHHLIAHLHEIAFLLGKRDFLIGKISVDKLLCRYWQLIELNRTVVVRAGRGYREEQHGGCKNHNLFHIPYFFKLTLFLLFYDAKISPDSEMNLKLSPFDRKNMLFFLKSVFDLQTVIPLHSSDYSQTQAQ